MRLTPKEQDRLLVFTAAELARRRRARGLRLNHPEAAALICDEVLEAARDGASYEDARRRGSLLGRDDVLDGVPEMLAGLQVEALFPDGTRLVVLDRPIP
jgi:urease subunit gamma